MSKKGRVRKMQGNQETIQKGEVTHATGGSAESRQSPQRIPETATAEEKIRLQAQLLNMVEPAIIATDLAGTIIFCNRFAETLYGWTAAEVQGCNVADVVSAPAVKEQATTIIARLQGGKSWSGEFLVQRRDGTNFLAQVTHSPILDDEGKLIGIVDVSSDASQRKQTAEALQKTNSILNAVIEGASDGVFVKDAEGRYLLVNAAGAAYFGLTPAEMIGKDAAQLVASEHAQIFRANDLRVMQTGRAEIFEETLALAGGTRTIQTVKAPFRDPQDNIIGIVGISRDITVHKQTEKALRKQAALLDLSLDAIFTRDLNDAVTYWNEGAERLYGWSASEALRQISHRLLQTQFPISLQQFKAQLAQKGQWQGELVHRTRKGESITVISRQIAERDEQGAPVAILETNTDVTAYNQSEAALQQLTLELERRVGERTAELVEAVAEWKQSEEIIQTLFRISKKLNSTLDLDTLMDNLVQEAIQMVNAESGFAGLRTAEGMTMRTYFHQGTAIPFEYTWSSGKGLPGWVLEHKVPYLTNDAANDPTIVPEVPINVGLRSVICTPILDSHGAVLGYFDLRNKRAEPGFTRGDQEMLMALSPVASIAIQNAMAYRKLLWVDAELKYSYEQLRAFAANLQSVREEERIQIARELHDELGQALTALKFDLAWLTSRLARRDMALRDKARSLTTQIDTTIKTVRRISSDLRPGMLDDLGLAAAIEWQAKEFQTRTGIDCQVSISNQDLALTRAQSTALFRIFQETLTNVARHAGANHISVKLEVENDGLTLQVKDNGRGIQASEIAGTHSLGLLGMRERAELLGGVFNIHGAPATGTTVTVSIPLAGANAVAEEVNR